jgi:vacuolar-type H+-ATPase subunit H
MPLDQILSEKPQADAAAEQQRAVEEGARLCAAATADAVKRRNELIQEVRRAVEREEQRLLAEARKWALRRSAAERKQHATVREASVHAERLRGLAREAAEIVSPAQAPFAPVPVVLRRGLIAVDLRVLGLVPEGFPAARSRGAISASARYRA